MLETISSKQEYIGCIGLPSKEGKTASLPTQIPTALFRYLRRGFTEQNLPKSPKLLKCSHEILLTLLIR